MALETGTYISDLVPTNPVASDPVAQAAGHLNLIKQTLQNTFPNVKGAVSATDENLSNGTPVGLIAMWSGSSIPSGWALCNGVAVNLSDGSGTVTPPNLMDRFIVGSGNLYTEGATGGNASNTLTIAQLPAHTHTASSDTQGNHVHTVADGQHSHPLAGYVSTTQQFLYSGGGGLPGVGYPYSGNSSTGMSSSNISILSGGAHSHNISVANTGTGAAVENRPPYYALAFIMKV